MQLHFTLQGIRKQSLLKIRIQEPEQTANIKMNIIPEFPLPCREGEMAVNARLLYIYVGRPEISYAEWAESLRQMASSHGHVSRFRIMTGDDGELALNQDFATYYAQQVASDLMGAIALILIMEGAEAASRGDLNYTNRMLDVCKVLALAHGQMSAEHLHAFLQVKQPYSQWLIELKKRHSMKYGSDYVRLSFESNGSPKFHKTDNKRGFVMFGPRKALEIAAAEPTRRGKLVRKYSRSLELGEDGLSGF